MAGYPRPVTTPTRAPRTRRAAAPATPDPPASDGTDAAAPAPGADPDGGIGDVHELLKAAVDEAARLLDADGAMVYLIDPETGHLRFAHDAGIRSRRSRNWVRTIDLPVGVGMFGRAVAERSVVMTSDYLNDTAFAHAPDTDRVVRDIGIRSMVVAPLVSGETVFGALGTFSANTDAFSPSAIGLVRALADHAAASMSNAHLIDALDASRRELAERADVERSLREIAARISAATDLPAVLQLGVDEAARLLHADGARIDLIDPNVGLLRWAYASGAVQPSDEEWPDDPDEKLDQGISGQAVVTGRAFWSGDYISDTRFPHGPGADQYIEGSGLHSVMAAPLSVEGVPIGALTVFSSRVDAWGEKDGTLLEAIADQAAITIRTTRLIDELERSQASVAKRADTERALRDITARIAALREPEVILDRVVDEAMRLLATDGAHLTRMGEDGTYLVPVVVAGATDPEMQAWLLGLRFPMGGGINGLAAGLGEPVWTKDYIADARIPHEGNDDEVAERMGLRGMAAAPLRAPGGEVIGTLAISSATPREFEPEERDLLQGLADQAAIAITNSTLLSRLTESEVRYRYLVENAPDLVWSIGADARITFLSEAVERLTGFRPEELIGQHFGALVHASSREVAEFDWTSTMEAPSQEVRGRLNLQHRDGSPVPAEFIAVATLDAVGKFAGANGAVRDMRERDRLERELRASEDRYRTLASSSPDLVFATDREGHYTFLSDRAQTMLGWDLEAALGRPFVEFVAPGFEAEAAASHAAVLAEPTSVHSTRIDFLDGSGRPVQLDINVVGKVEDGEVVGINGVARDVSERTRLERELRRQAGELAAGEERAHLARELHDSVTQALFSMTLVSRSIELLLATDPDAARVHLAQLRELQREALAEMRALIFELRPGNLQADGLVRALKTHSAALQGRLGLPVVVESDVDERLPLAGEEALYRIAQEALHNVVKHAGARQVRVEIRRHDGGVRLRVTDDGKGFDPTTVPDGHLGLAGMRARAERVGATFACESRVGTGTSVEVTLSPMALDVLRAAAPVAEAAAPDPVPAETPSIRDG